MSPLFSLIIAFMNMYVFFCFLKSLSFFEIPIIISSRSMDQSHYIEVVQGDIFMEQTMRLGLVLGWLAILKKIGADYEQLLKVFFSGFLAQKMI